VQDAFCRALEIWKIRGVPDNPSAWLMATAKNRALDALRRQRTARSFAPEIEWQLENEQALTPMVENIFSANAIKDDQLRMMFSCCQPRLAEEAQVALVLHILCGFSVDEIASAFVSSQAAIEKRITRAKKVLAGSKRLFDVAAPSEFAARLPTVHRALYLLFNEGYHGASTEAAMRVDLCREAMRLTELLMRHRLGGTPATFALAALMRLHAARLSTRVDSSGNLSALFDQDRSLWDQQLLEEGLRLLELSATGTELSEYHIESAIAALHTTASSTEKTDWAAVVQLYDALMSIRPSPVVALNRAIAVAQLAGPERGLQEIHAIADSERLASYPFYFAALGELHLRLDHRAAALEKFREARRWARNAMEEELFERRIHACASS
jgi:RNA polymerase sigma factor (sigma-70 family)